MHQHKFIPSTVKDYEVCECGTYHSIAQTDPKVLYQEQDYWSYEFHHSKPEEQVKNLNEEEGTGISKVNIVLKYVPQQAKDVLEIGCCPGELLRRLVEMGYETMGIEPAGNQIDFICKHALGASVVNGFFPQVFLDDAKELFDCIIFMDCLEHTDDYNSFIMAVHRLLKADGVGICMSPIIFEDSAVRIRDFTPSEHCYIHSKKFLEPYLNDIFKEVKWDRWVTGHELFIAYK